MTSVAFHFNAPSKLAYACRLLRKAVSSGTTAAVLGDEAMICKLDEQLWSFSALDFVPHGRAGSMAEQQRALTPIWLCSKAAEGLGRQVLVNLTSEIPVGFESFERVIEVVSQDEADRQSARARWKHYSERSMEIVRHDLKLNS